MINIKRKYNKWLFKKYGFDVGLFYEKIPIILRLIPLFSPSIYTREQGQQFSVWFMEGIQQCLETSEKVKLTKE